MLKKLKMLFSKPRGVCTELGLGDALDRLSILEIKVARLSGERQEIARENFCDLRDDLIKAKCDPLSIKEYSDLLKVNSELWDVEDEIRTVGKIAFADILGDASKKFMHLARLVYRLNDKRSEYKRTIDINLETKHQEVKSYCDIKE